MMSRRYALYHIARPASAFMFAACLPLFTLPLCCSDRLTRRPPLERPRCRAAYFSVASRALYALTQHVCRATGCAKRALCGSCQRERRCCLSCLYTARYYARASVPFDKRVYYLSSDARLVPCRAQLFAPRYRHAAPASPCRERKP